MLNIAVFFYPRKLKMPKKPFVSLFLFFFSIENIFLAHFHNILSGILKFSDGWIFFFSLRKKNFKVFFFWRDTFLFFVLGFFFLLWNFAVFSLAHFASRAVFKSLSRAVWNLLGQEMLYFFEMFFFYRVIYFKIMYPFRFATVFLYLSKNIR